MSGGSARTPQHRTTNLQKASLGLGGQAVEPRLTKPGARFIDGEHHLIADVHVARQPTVRNPRTARMTAMDNIATTAARLRSSGI